MGRLLGHPIHAIREPFGTAGLIVAIVALVAALGGGAYAVSNGLTGKQKKEVEKIAKKYAGKSGVPGAAGPQGPVGPQGAAGGAGTNGASGVTGATGKNGATGATGTTGTTGPTGPVFETLPSGHSETGTWSLYVPPTVESYNYAISIPFAIPLEKAGTEAFFFTKEQVEEEEFGTSGCSWSFENAEKRPESSKKGVLCVFRGEEFFFTKVSGAFIQNPSDPGAGVGRYGPSGASILLVRESLAEPKPLQARGTWAVQAP